MEDASASEIDFELCPPRASSLVESLRSFGYDLATAIADLVDNSVSSGAQNIWIDFTWHGEASAISITDDGRGMSLSELSAAMLLGSKNPRELREAKDLGRFGLGLKTASFSQCRCLTVKTRLQNKAISTRRWDLDHLATTDKWHLLKDGRINIEVFEERFKQLTQGTLVLWQSLDRIVKNLEVDNERHRDGFYRQAETVESHLGLVFHRLLTSPHKLCIYLNDRPLKRRDPFFVIDATQVLEPQTMMGRFGIIKVEPFVMPHESKLLDGEAKRLAGDPKDWIARQGFYIYRQDRLLVAGSWLGFRDWRKDNFHKLARIRIDLTNSADEDWQIDVTKSKARPPEELREWLHRIGEAARSRAKRVYTFRGERQVTREGRDISHVWNQFLQHGSTSYQINRAHPLIASLLRGSLDLKNMDAVLKLIEETVPIPLIAYSAQAESRVPSLPFGVADIQEVRDNLLHAFGGLIATGLTKPEATQMLRFWEPYNRFTALIDEL